MAPSVSRSISDALLALVAAGLLCAGCDPAPCVRVSDCPSGLVCSPTGRCGPPPVDADVSDAGADATASAPDASADGGATDAGTVPVDAGLDDASDGSAADVGADDAGIPPDGGADGGGDDAG